MKKFTSILCALAIVFSASAAPVGKKVLDTKGLKGLDKVHTELKAKDGKALKAKKADKAFALLTEKKANANRPARVNRIARAAKDDVTFTIVVEDITTTGATVTVTPSDNETAYCWDVYETANLAGMSDADIAKDFKDYYDYLIAYYADYGYELTYEDLLTAGEDDYTYKNLSPNTDYTVVAIAVDENFAVVGASAKKQFKTPDVELTGETITINYEESIEAPFFYNDGSVEVGFENDDYYVVLTYFPETPQSAVGSYTEEDFDPSYTYIYVGDTKVAIVKGTLVVVEEANRLNFTANLTGADGNVYAITMFYAIPQAQGQETITATNLAFDDTYLSWMGVIFADASNDKFSVSLTINVADELEAGDIVIGTDANGTITILAQSEEEENVNTSMYSGTLTLAEDGGNWSLTGTVLCENNIEYTLNLTYVKPEANRQAELTLSNLKANIFDGGWQLSGFSLDKTNYVSIAALTDEVSGNYTAADLEAAYCYIYTDLVLDEEGYVESGNKFSLVDANLTVAFDEETQVLTITGTFVGVNGDDVPEFTLNLTGSVPAPVDPTGETFEIEVTDIKANGATVTVTPSAEGATFYWDVAEASDLEGLSDTEIQTWIMANIQETIDYYGGQYTLADFLSDEEDSYTYKSLTGNTDYVAYAVYLDKDGNFTGDIVKKAFKTLEPEYIDLTFTIKKDANGITVTPSDNENAWDYIIVSKAVFDNYGAEAIATSVYGQYGDSYAVTGANTFAWDGQVIAAYCKTAGTYVIVVWGAGEDAVTTPAASFEFAFPNDGDAVDNINADAVAVKAIENGQLIINVNGVRYNAVGATIR